MWLLPKKYTFKLRLVPSVERALVCGFSSLTSIHFTLPACNNDDDRTCVYVSMMKEQFAFKIPLIEKKHILSPFLVLKLKVLKNCITWQMEVACQRQRQRSKQVASEIRRILQKPDKFSFVAYTFLRSYEKREIWMSRKLHLTLIYKSHAYIVATAHSRCEWMREENSRE